MTINDNTQAQAFDNAQTQVLSSGQAQGFDNAQSQVTQVMGSTRLGRAAASAAGYTTDHIKPCNCVILADCSSSVHKSIGAINQGIAGVRDSICKDPVSAKAANVAVVAFNSEVKVLPLADAGETAVLGDGESAPVERAFVSAESMPAVELRAKGATHLNEAVLKALELEREQVNRQALNGHTPHRSVVVILSDGADYPGGSVLEAAEAINAAKRDRGLKVLFCGFGDYKEECAELLSPDGFFSVEDGEPVDDFLDMVGKFMRVFSSDKPGAAPNIDTKIGSSDSPVHFISPRGMTFREFLAA